MAKKSKADKQIGHLKRRFKERYAIYLCDTDIKSIIESIQNGKAAFVERQSNRIAIFDVGLNGDTYRVVYDSHRKVPVTVFPEDCDENDS